MGAHTEGPTPTISELLALPWTRELIPDEHGYFGRIKELDGCISEGPTAAEALENLDDALHSWLEVAVDQGDPIPRPHVELEEFSGRFSVRVPRTLHRALTARAELEHSSLNQLVTTLLSSALPLGVRSDTSVTQVPGAEDSAHSDAYEDIAADAVRRDPRGVGALKGIATWLRNRGDTNLAVVLYAIAGERSAAINNDNQAAAAELGVAGALARRHRRLRLAEALWRESILRDPTNIRSRSSLGQLLQHQGRFTEAIEYLEPVADVDNYAQLSLGWCLLYQGVAAEDEARVTKGLTHLVTAMRRWCAYANRTQLSPWLRQLARLEGLGARFSPEVDQLLSFANSNANWGRIDRSSLTSQQISDESVVEADERAALEATARGF